MDGVAEFYTGGEPGFAMAFARFASSDPGEDLAHRTASRCYIRVIRVVTLVVLQSRVAKRAERRKARQIPWSRFPSPRTYAEPAIP